MLDTFSILCKLGRRRSESTISTRWPFWAKTVARLKTVVDLPSPGAGADDGDGVELVVLAREQEVGAQHAVGLRVRAFRPFVDQGSRRFAG